MISWHIVTSEMYHNGTKLADGMYFLSDTREIYRGEQPFTESVIMYNDALPNAPAIARNRLYINSSTLEGWVYQGEALGWVQVIKPVSDTVEDVAGTPVSGKAVVAYVAAEMAKSATAAGTVSALGWDSANHILTVTKGDESSETITFDGLGVSLNYNAQTGALQLLDASGNLIGDAISLDLERFVAAAEYNAETQNIVLYFDADKTDFIEIPVGDLVDTYTAEGSDNTLALSVETGNKIVGHVKISTAAGNLITCDENGLYVAPIDISGKMDKVEGAVEGNIATLDGNGQVVDSGKSFADIANNSTVYTGASIDEAVAGNVPVKGDYCIVKTQIGETDKYQYTAYVHNGTSWEAMDGNYSAENVYFPADLTTTSAVGNITLSNGQATISAAGKNLIDVWNSIFVKANNNFSVTQPSVTVTLTEKGSYEVGTVKTINYSATLNAGSYQYGPATGITATSWSVSATNNGVDAGSSTTNAGTFDSITVGDTTSYKISATATYDDGAMPVNNLKQDTPAKQIKAGSKTGTSATITGYRRGFYGTLTKNCNGVLTSDDIRGLAQKTSATPVKGNKWTLDVPVGAMCFVVAYPATVGDIASIVDVGGGNFEIVGNFKKTQVNVEGANGYEAIAYNVYYLDRVATTATNTLNVTL